VDYETYGLTPLRNAVHSAAIARKHAEQGASRADCGEIAVVCDYNVVCKSAAGACRFKKLAAAICFCAGMARVIPRGQRKQRAVQSWSAAEVAGSRRQQQHVATRPGRYGGKNVGAAYVSQYAFVAASSRQWWAHQSHGTRRK
jgi:hypothetical protein